MFKLPNFTVDALNVIPQEIPWGITQVNAPMVWGNGAGEGVVVAIIDTGVDIHHPDLKDHIIGGRNFTSDYGGDPDNFSDNAGHGTHCAGTICASANGSGVVGVAPEAKLLVLKSMDGAGRAGAKPIVDAVNYATQWRGAGGEKVRIISMSLGTPVDHPELHTAIQNAVASGILVVAAAGNEGDGTANTMEGSYPGCYHEVVEVGAIDQYKCLAHFSNTNMELDVVAPGVSINSTYLNGTYAVLSGTSMATPHVAGSAAVIISQLEKSLGRELSEPEIYAQVIKRTRSITGLPLQAQGNGLIDLTIDAPLDFTKQPVAQEPPVQAKSYTVSLSVTVKGDAVDVRDLTLSPIAGQVSR